MNPFRGRLYVLLGLVGITCRTAPAPGRLPRLAYMDSREVIAPDTVDRNAPFEVGVHVITGQCRQPGRTDVQIAGQVAVIVLYPDTKCSQIDIGIGMIRRVTIRFAEPGTGAIRVIAEGSVGPQTIERLVRVR